MKVDRNVRAELRKTRFEQRAVGRETAASLARHGNHDRVLTEPETRVVLELLTRALLPQSEITGLENPSDSAGRTSGPLIASHFLVVKEG
ncbi:hypothetical protein [Actinocorallia populi]|uniref:hypothetical protein n=1 Tax=Actinocorallia populi TaxID=2079200 RepID=UPI000D7C69CA